MNRVFGRRGTIFITATLSWLTCFWQGVTNSWPHLFVRFKISLFRQFANIRTQVARLVLGLGVGPKSTTVPVYAAECSPAPIRGALVMMWQMWTAFGIMLGFVADLAFYYVKDTAHIKGLNWRLMLGSVSIALTIAPLQSLIFFRFRLVFPRFSSWLRFTLCPSLLVGSWARVVILKLSTRCAAFAKPSSWLPVIFSVSCILLVKDIRTDQSPDIHTLLEAEEEIKPTGRLRILELFTVPRNRRAALGSFIVMFMQQFCGVNVIAYYSSTVFKQSGLGDIQAILGSWGFGMLNFVFALPAVYMIDTFGRRFLLLTTFPGMSACLLLTGMAL